MTTFTGSAGNDILTGGSSSDTLVGAGGNDTLTGAGGDDLLIGNAGADYLDGGDGNDVLFSGDQSPPWNLGGLGYYGPVTSPAPTLDTGTEVDTLIGGAGDDKLFAGYGDNVDGGANDVYGDYLYISFLGAPSGITADFSQPTQSIGGGTITGIENVSWIQGSNFDDYIKDGGGNGYSYFPVIYGMGGNDHIIAGYYTGEIYGGDGNDIIDGRPSQYLRRVDGGDGDDTLYTNSNTFAAAYGGAGNDTIYSHGLTHGDAGNDVIVLQPSFYTGQVFGDDGDDQITASSSGNFMVGGSGADTITGGTGNDTLYSADLASDRTSAAPDMGLEHDILSGGGGNDVLAIGYGDDADGGPGSDTLSLSLGGLQSGIVFDTSGIVSAQPFVLGGGTIQNIEILTYLRGTDFNDVLTLATQGTLLTVDAGGGDDVIYSNNSSVSVSGGAGDDRFVSGAAADIFDGGAGVDTIDYSLASAGATINLTAGSGPGGDQLINVENVVGSAFDDIIIGTSGDNVLDGAGGVNTISYGDATAGVSVSLALQGTAQGTLGDGTDTLSNFQNLTGSAFNDVLEGDGNDNRLDGGGGVNTVSYAHATSGVTVSLASQNPQDTIGAGQDTLSNFQNLRGSSYADHLTGDGADNIIDGGAGDDVIDGGAGTNTVSYASASSGVGVSLALQGQAQNTVGAGADTLSNFQNLTGSAFNDTLEGDSGANILDGGSGVNTVSYAHATSGVTVSLTLQGSGQNTVGAGTDTLSNFQNLTGSAFDDTLEGASGNNILDGGAGTNTVSYAHASSGVTVSLAAQGLAQNTGGAGTDTLSNFQNLTGSAFNDTLEGDSGANILDGGSGVNTVSYAHATSGVTVSLTLQGSRQNTVGAGTDTLSNFQNLTGSAFDDTLEGASGNNILDGGAGSNTVSYAHASSGVTVSLAAQGLAQNTGGAGTDTLSNFQGLIGSAYRDTLTGSAGTSSLTGGGGGDTFKIASSAASTTITDFSHDQGDKIDLSALPQFTSLASIMAAAVQDGANTVIHTTSGSITLDNVTAANLTAADFSLTATSGPNLALSYPYNCVCYITDVINGMSYRASGVIVGPHTILTAAHVLWDADSGQSATDIVVQPGYSSTYTTSFTAAAIHYNPVDDSEDKLYQDQSQHDFAVIDVAQNLTSYGWFGIDTDFSGGTGGIAGYPASNGYTQQDTSGLLTVDPAYDVIDYSSSLGVSPGSSGGPIWINETTGSEPGPYVVGLVSTVSWGAEITSSDLAQIRSWVAQDAGSWITAAGDMTGSGFVDHLLGDSGDNTINGKEGDDTIDGGAGNDVMDGGEGVNTASYGSATDGVTVSLALQGHAQNTIGAGADTLSEFQNLTGSAYNDTLEGDANNNVLDGGAGTNTVSYAHANSGVTVSLALQGQAQNTGGAGTDTLYNFQSLIGSAFNDRLTGDSRDNVLTGGLGADTFVVSDGHDTIADFSVAQGDRIELTASTGLRSLDAVQAAAAASGGDTVITFPDGASLTVNGVTPAALTASDFIFGPVIPGDFLGTGHASLFWQNAVNNLTSAWLLTDAAPANGMSLPAVAGWQTYDVGNFEGGYYGGDFLLRNTTTGMVDIWQDNNGVMSGHDVAQATLDWQIMGTADFNGDGKSDVLWRNEQNGYVSVWQMDGANVSTTYNPGVVGLQWKLVGANDFYGDGKAEVLWRDPGTGEVNLWTIDGPGAGQTHGQTVAHLGAEWNVAGTDDFNGDGKADILWFDTVTGQVVVWEMNGPTVTAAQPIGDPGPQWRVVDVADISGDGKADILWRDTGTGQVVAWAMNGFDVDHYGVLGTVDNSWKVIDHHYDLA